MRVVTSAFAVYDEVRKTTLAVLEQCEPDARKKKAQRKTWTSNKARENASMDHQRNAAR